MSATGRGASRSALDFYATPKWVAFKAAQVLVAERIGAGVIVDAGCGTGALGLVAPALDEVCIGVELDEARAQQAQSSGQYRSVYVADFLQWAPAYGEDVSAVIANPPFAYAREFVDASRALTRGPVCMLLRLAFLAGQKRREWWQENPADVHVLSRRPSFTGRGTDSTDYAWFVWGPGPRGRVRVM